MSALLPSPYSGILEDIHVVRIGQILGLPVAASAVTVATGYYESFPFSVEVQRDQLFAAIRVFEDNVQVESKVLEIIRKWDALPLADETMVAERSRRALRDALRAIYPVFVNAPDGGMISGR